MLEAEEERLLGEIYEQDLKDDMEAFSRYRKSHPGLDVELENNLHELARDGDVK